MTDTIAELTARLDFRATGDPAPMDDADVREVSLLAREGERQLGSTSEETQEFATRALARRLKAIGLAPAAA